MCKVQEWSLSYEFLTGVQARSKLQELKNTDLEFWKELTTRWSKDIVPPEDVKQPKDKESTLTCDMIENDDSNVPISAIVGMMLEGSSPSRFSAQEDGGMMCIADAECADDVNVMSSLDKKHDSVPEDMGQGKCMNTANRLYKLNHFWRHDDESTDEEM